MQRKGCLFAVFAFLFGQSDRAAEGVGRPRVYLNKKFVSPAEGDFFRVLRAVVGARGHVLAQVSLRQLLWFPSGPGVQAWRNKTAARAIDFVVCDAGTLRPLVAFELNEPSHARPDRQTRDDEVRTVLAAAGLPLLEINAARAYDTRGLEEALAPYLPAAGR